MYNPIPNGSVEVIYDYYKCHVPPVGWGVNIATCELEKTDVVKRSNKAPEQYWERTSLPQNWKKRRVEEEKKQKVNPDYIDPELEKFRVQEWGRRLRGFWFYNNGKPTYITGLHYFYINWWKIDIGYPHYREPDRKFFYVLKYCILDPRSAGLIEATKRRQGKTFRGGCFLYEDISRNIECEGGIQSKTNDDAKKVVFQKALVSPFKKLPDFFIPVFDASKGITPTTELRFSHTTKKGSKALDNLDKPELNSLIDYTSSDPLGYDGRKKRRYFADEVGKTKEVNVHDRHSIVRYCLETDGEWTGKALYSTTVEEMESGGAEFLMLWQDSHPNERDENGHTATGLYRFMTPAYETLYFDAYGFPDVEKAKTYFINRRKGLEHNPRALASEIRKNPFNEQEMFRIDGERCLYDAMKLNDRMDFLSWNKDITERGNFKWEGAIRDSRVVWEKNEHGRWEIPKGFSFPKEEDSNKIVKRGNIFLPGNKLKFVSGVDPYDHDVTEDSRRSMAASLVKQKHNPLDPDGVFNGAFVCMYYARPATAPLFYEDMILQCVYFGCQMLHESQKPGVARYFKDRGYADFLITLPDYKDAGIPSTPQNKQTLAELTEDYIDTSIEKVFFKRLIKQWLEFELMKTEKYDLAMAAGWCLVADMHKLARKEVSELRDVNDYFRTHKVKKRA
jgi:hypothetical protein